MSVPSTVDSLFWRGKNVFLTGHTGFKGGWLALWLNSMGANVTGYGLEPNTSPSFFETARVYTALKKSVIADIRDLGALQNAMSDSEPDVVIHMAAQPLVRASYQFPVETYATNVMGTVHLLESARQIKKLKATVIVTTDKCYQNKEWEWGYRESDALGGDDPYSSSKGCAEIVTAAYRRSFFSKEDFQSGRHCNLIASARAGNVIGGGDWSLDRLIPDAIKAFVADQPLTLRNPDAVRPWQHVLDPLSGYLILAQALYNQGVDYASSWNFGPSDNDSRTVGELVDVLAAYWPHRATWCREEGFQPHEANLLRLDCAKAKWKLGWVPGWSLEIAVKKIVAWHEAYSAGLDMKEFSLNQIKEYVNREVQG